MASSPPRPWMVLDPEVPLSRSPPAVAAEEATAAKAAPVERASMSISAAVMVAIFFICVILLFRSLGLCGLPLGSSPCRPRVVLVLLRFGCSTDRSVPPRKAADHTQNTHNAHTAATGWAWCGREGNTTRRGGGAGR